MKITGIFLLVLFGCHTIQAQRSIDTAYAIKIGGIEQWVSIRGKDISHPLLLWLHGGPGSSAMQSAAKYTGKLQEQFLVVQWDQRETGKTNSLNKSDQPLTLRLFQNDTHDLIDSLLSQFQQKKLYLAGHSWGTALGFYIAGKFPELLYAYIAISPMVNQLESEQITLTMLKEDAMKNGNKKEMNQLSTVRIPFENGEQLYYDRKWLYAYNGQKFLAITFREKMVVVWASIWLQVFNEASKEDLFMKIPEINCPVYFFTGRKDFQTHFTVTQEYYNKLIAPKKQWYWFEKSGHMIPDTESDLMQDIIINRIYPETFLP